HLTKLARDRQAESGAAILPCGRGINLRKFLEQMGHLLRRHANASVNHRDLDKLPPLMQGRRDLQLDVTRLSKLAGIAQEMQNNLPQPHRIGFDRSKIRWAFDG